MGVHVTERDVMVPLTNGDLVPEAGGLCSNAQQEAGVPSHVATVETVPWNLIRLIPA